MTESTRRVERSEPRCRPVRRQDLQVHELDGEALIFDPTCNDTHRLNETAAFIWRLCDGTYNAHGIAKCLAGVYDVTQDQAAAYVERALKDLQARGLVVDAVRSAHRE